ncbi:RNA polymerase sigma factor [Prochlorococcus marinus XMU1419]|nr:RNA polymerase sigma factor [Prochlorococcus marinus]MBO8234120.1 RNA polymerase sigma factor [Prochlorococcus marinus XMU1419]
MAKGDKESFRFIANALGYKMHRTAIKILGSSHFEDADDVVQISLIKVWQTAPRWKNKGSVEGYIYKIVFSTCMDFIRKYKNAEEFKDNYFNLEILDNINNTNELRKMLLKKIQKLSKEQQEAILLHYFSGYKQKEVSNILKKSEKATESLIIRARKKLKTILPKDILEEFLHV